MGLQWLWYDLPKGSLLKSDIPKIRVWSKLIRHRATGYYSGRGLSGASHSTERKDERLLLKGKHHHQAETGTL